MAKNINLAILFLLFVFPLYGQLATQPPVKQEKRLALVIGNGNYTSSVLANPENDAKAITTVLRRLGFTVFPYQNLNQSQMKKAIDEFGMKLKGNDVGLFYYAGHGIQSGGVNYLIPVDAQLDVERQVEYDCVQIDRMLGWMDEAGSEVNILILDACRNNPFEKKWKRAVTGKGLASMNAPSGTLIAYATAPGTTASDGSGKNSPYTSAILESIDISDITITQMFQIVTRVVSQKSAKQQIPWTSSSLTADFYFNPEKTAGQPEQGVLQAIPFISLPSVTAPEISNKTSTEASLKATVDNDGGADVVARGICYSTSEEPTVISSKTKEGDGTGSFSSTLSGLAPNKTYYARAYAINSVGTFYSSQVSLKTDPAQPVITTTEVSRITSASAIAGGNISDDGGSGILARGICWSTSSNPTVKESKTENGKGLGTFTTPVMVLLPDTTYYLRAYCTNDVETHYGNEIVFKTLKSNQIIDIDENIYNTVTFINQTWMAENLKATRYNDGTPIPMVVDKIAWRNQITSSYCWYDNQEVYKMTYGALYNWQTVNTGKLCPVGWHIPSNEEWSAMVDAIDAAIGYNYAGGYLKEQGNAHWGKLNKGALSHYNRFSALPGGYRDEMGEFRDIGTNGYWWSSYDNKKLTAWYRMMESSSTNVVRKKVENNSLGYSVRCIKD